MTTLINLFRYFFLFIMIAIISCGPCNKQAAESEFLEWVTELNLSYQSFVCNGDDSDNDDYVSCSYLDMKDNIHTVECAKAFTPFLSGCREPKFKIK